MSQTIDHWRRWQKSLERDLSAANVSSGTLLTSTDPLGNVTTYTYTPQGQLATVRTPSPISKTTTLDYNTAGDLVKATDPLGNESLVTPDDAGRPSVSTAPLGFSTQTAFNPVDQVTQVTDAAGGETKFAYDARRNLAGRVKGDAPLFSRGRGKRGRTPFLE